MSQNRPIEERTMQDRFKKDNSLKISYHNKGDIATVYFIIIIILFVIE
jgi:hypothetical protein